MSQTKQQKEAARRQQKSAAAVVLPNSENVTNILGGLVDTVRPYLPDAKWVAGGAALGIVAGYRDRQRQARHEARATAEGYLPAASSLPMSPPRSPRR